MWKNKRPFHSMASCGSNIRIKNYQNPLVEIAFSCTQRLQSALKKTKTNILVT